MAPVVLDLRQTTTHKYQRPNLSGMAGLVDIVTSIPELVRSISEIALSDPLSAVLITVGGLLIAGTVGLTAYLVLGVLVSAVIPDLSGGQPPQAR